MKSYFVICVKSDPVKKTLGYLSFKDYSLKECQCIDVRGIQTITQITYKNFLFGLC